MNPTFRMLRSSLLRYSLLLAVPLLLAQAALAQGNWRQTVEIIVPVERENEQNVTGVFLDSLVTYIENDDIQVRRDREDETTYTLSQIEDNLSYEGLFLNSANRVFITYKMEGNSRGFSSDIKEVFFIYRPDGEYADVDIPVLYLDGENPTLKRLLNTSGTNLRYNEAAFKPFRDQIAMHQLAKTSDAIIVRYGENGQYVIYEEDESERERVRLVNVIRRFID
ncbi:MAG: hypothetical protein AAF809_02885 [Bacteroidota bacterium]